MTTLKRAENRAFFKWSIFLSLILSLAVLFSYAFASNFVFNGSMANGEWNDTGNWDEFAIPGPSDDVVINGSVQSDSSAAASVNSLVVNSGAFSITISVAAGASFYVSNGGIVNGNATFYDTAENNGSVSGNLIRYYTSAVSPITPNRDFTGWNEIVADNAVVTLDGSTGLGSTALTSLNGGSFVLGGCMDSGANNYNPQVTYDNATCTYDDPGVPGCTDPGANNYNAEATDDDGSCTYDDPIFGCTDPGANNYNPAATNDDSSCTYDPADTDPPVLSSAVAEADGTTLTLTYGESLDTASVPATGDFIVNVNGGTVTIDSVSILGTDVTLVIAQSIVFDDVIALTYTPGVSPIQDNSGNDAGALVDQPVTNNVPSNEDTDPPSAPATPDLESASDGGVSTTDDITNDNTPTFYISNCEVGATVHVTKDATSQGSAACDSEGHALVTLDEMSDGTYDFLAYQIDGASNQSDNSSTISITIDTVWGLGDPDTAPDLITDTGSDTTDNITKDSTPTFTGTGCSPGIYFLLYSDGDLIATYLCEATEDYVITSNTGLIDAGHTILIKEGDTAGNLSLGSPTIVVTTDTSAPPTIGNPDMIPDSDSGSSNTDNITNDNTPAFNVNCPSSDVSFAIIYSNGVAKTAGTDCPDAEVITLITNTLSSGSNTITYTLTDIAGNESSPSNSISITVDNTAPATSGAPDMTAGTDSGISSTDNITNDNTPTFTGSCTDGNTVQLFDDGISSGSSAACSGSTFTLTTATLATGANSITFKETDVAGNTSSASSALSVTIDTTSPAVSLTAPTDGATVSGSSVTISANASDTNLGGVQFKRNTNTNIGVEDTTSAYSVDWDTTALSNGGQTLIAVAKDLAGNYATSTSISVTINNVVADTGGGGGGGGSYNTNNVINGGGGAVITYGEPLSCKSGQMFNIFTGTPCTQSMMATTSNPVLPIPCTQGQQYNILTGAICKSNAIVVFPLPHKVTPTPQVTLPPNLTFTKDLYFPIVDPEVRELQKFLNTHGFIVSRIGNGRPGFEINRFGPGTRAALAAFQKASGIKPSVGYFGPITRSYVNNILSVSRL